jgi:hypothetical protein
MGPDGDSDPVDWFREIMELMAPDVIVVPIIGCKPQERPEELWQKLLPIAEEYARRMDWGWERPLHTAPETRP